MIDDKLLELMRYGILGALFKMKGKWSSRFFSFKP